jgi:hypothetical protein
VYFQIKNHVPVNHKFLKKKNIFDIPKPMSIQPYQTLQADAEKPVLPVRG